MDLYKIAQRFEEKLRAVPYPENIKKPIREDYKSNTEWGVAMDEYERLKALYYDGKKTYNQVISAINAEFKEALLAELGVSNHPKREVLYRLAWEYGHSGGYGEVASHAEDLAELVK